MVKPMASLFFLALASAFVSSKTATEHRHNPLSLRHDTRRLQKTFFGDHEEMMIVQSMPEEIDVDPRLTYNQKFMALMTSPCRPEPDGFFGATSGDPIRLQYGFQLEIEPLSDILMLLDVLEDKIVDEILLNTFPVMCGMRRRMHTTKQQRPESAIDLKKSRILSQEESRPSGFRFIKFHEVGTCNPQLNDTNFCGVFVGIVDIFERHGRGGEAAFSIKSLVDAVLGAPDSQNLHAEIIAIRLDEEHTSIVDSSGSTVVKMEESDETEESDGGLSRVAILILVIASMLVLAICYYCYIQWSERKIGDTIFSDRKSSSAAFIKSKTPYKNYDPQERSIRASPSCLETEDVFDGESFVDEYEKEETSLGTKRSHRTRRSRAIESHNSKSSLQYSSRESSRCLEMEDIEIDAYSDEYSSNSKRSIDLL